MRLSAQIRVAISLVVLGISIVVWVFLLLNPGNFMTVEHCPVADLGPFCKAPNSEPFSESLQVLLGSNPVPALLLGWGLMVIAMMFPKLIPPIQHIYMQSFKRRRLWSSGLFVFGYMGVWMVVGVFIIAVILALQLLMPDSYIPAIGLGIIAIVWQFTPIKQQCLNRGHEHWTLAAFGWAANRDALLFGVMHGVWCVASGWALMLFPMLLPEGHNLAMLIVTFIMLSEHLEHPRYPRWQISFRLKLLRIIIAQSRIKLKQVLELS